VPPSSRLFGVAINIPEPFNAELSKWRHELGDPQASAIPPHVTLLPPTPIAEVDLPAVEEHLRAIAEDEQPFDIQLAGSDSFRPVSPVVFVPLIEGAADCATIEGRVRSGPLDREVVFDYHPHVTVCHDVPEDVLDRAEAELAPYKARFFVWGFSLFEQGPDAVWRPQRDFPFGLPLPGPVTPDPA
jgi:2'-5' RNA ligase